MTDMHKDKFADPVYGFATPQELWENMNTYVIHDLNVRCPIDITNWVVQFKKEKKN